MFTSTFRDVCGSPTCVTTSISDEYAPTYTTDLFTGVLDFAHVANLYAFSQRITPAWPSMFINTDTLLVDSDDHDHDDYEQDHEQTGEGAPLRPVESWEADIDDILRGI